MAQFTGPGDVVHEVSKLPGSRLPFIALLAFLFFGPLYFVPKLWPILVVAFVLIAAVYVLAQYFSDRVPILRTVCENGLATTAKGRAVFIPWEEIGSVTAWSQGMYGGYDINAHEIRYRLSEGSLGKATVRAIVDTVVSRARLEWVHENIAVRPENAGVVNDVLAKVNAP